MATQAESNRPTSPGTAWSGMPPVEENENIPQQARVQILDYVAVEAVLDPDTDFGAVIRPKEDTLWNHKYLLSEGAGATDIRFSPDNYPLFDDVIYAQCCLAPKSFKHPAFTLTHRQYGDYAPLRRNLAILRNFLMGRYSPTGSNGKINQDLLRDMALMLAFALRGNSTKPHFFQQLLQAIRKLLGRPSGPEPEENRFLRLASVPDRGIAFMYNYLIDFHAGKLTISPPPLPKGSKFLKLEETPFSARNMRLYSNASQMEVITETLTETVKNLRSVDDLRSDRKEESVEHARNILNNLRIIASGVSDKKEFEVGDPRLREAKIILQAAVSMKNLMADIAKTDPGQLNDKKILQAEESLHKLGSGMRHERDTMTRQEGRFTARILAERSERNASYRQREQHEQLVQKVEEGLHRATEIRQMYLAQSKQASLMSQALNQQNPLQQVIKDGVGTMYAPQIHQVSYNNPDFIKTVKEVNEPPIPEPQKTNSGGQGMGGK